MGVMDNVKKLIQEMIVPELHEIKLKVSTIEVEIKRVDEKIDGIEKRLTEKIENLHDEFHLAIDMHERIAAIEAKIGLH